jgi:hypothetical protein
LLVAPQPKAKVEELRAKAGLDFGSAFFFLTVFAPPKNANLVCSNRQASGISLAIIWHK